MGKGLSNVDLPWLLSFLVTLPFLFILFYLEDFATGCVVFVPLYLVAFVGPFPGYIFIIYSSRCSLLGRSGHEELERLSRGSIHEMAKFVHVVLRFSRGGSKAG